MEFFLRKGTLGFFSDAFRLLESYMVCKQKGVKLYLNSSEWTFGHTLGWSDYFTSIAEKPEGGPLPEIAIDGEEIRQFTVAQYKQSIKELFIFQPHLLEKARALQIELGLDRFVAVFIRRGDKLLGESLFIPVQFYAQLALSKGPTAIFVQTDDYRAFLEFKDIIYSINTSIRVITTCPETKFGLFFTPLDITKGRSFSYEHNNTRYVYSQNLQYLSTNLPQKPLMDYTNAEMREHVEEMLVGIIICQSADFIVLDHMSNVSRFIHFSHPRGKAAILSIEDMDIQITEGVSLIKKYEYTEDKLIRNPRHHSIYNDYI
jgi:hypothetical protein